MGEPSRAGQMDDRERLSLSPARRAAMHSNRFHHKLDLVAERQAAVGQADQMACQIP